MRSSGKADPAERQWPRVRALFESACELNPPQRRAYLAQACAGDDVLRGEVESLFESFERTPKLFDAPAAEAFAELIGPPGAQPAAGPRFGPYEVKRLIARGGMGAVYSAVRADGQYEKVVALKVINALVASAELLSRFHAERQT